MEGGRLGLQVQEDVHKGGLCVKLSFIVFFFSLFLLLIFLGDDWPDLIAFAWGRTRMSEAGVPDDLFSPAYSGCCDRIMRP